MELIDKMVETGQSARQILQKIELVAIIDSEIWIYMPDEYSIDFPQSLLRLVQEPVNRVLAFFRIVQASIPDKNLYLEKNMLCPFEIWPPILRIVISQAQSPLRTPRFESLKPAAGLGRTVRAGEKYLAGRWRFRKVHHASYGDESVAGLPFIGRSRCNQENDNKNDGRTRKCSGAIGIHGYRQYHS